MNYEYIIQIPILINWNLINLGEYNVKIYTYLNEH